MGIRVSHFRPRGSVDFVSAASFAVWLRSERPDAVLITSWHSIPWAAFASRIAGVPRVLLRQGIVRRAPSRGVRAHALRRWIDDVITNAPEIRDVWIESNPSFPSERVHVVLNAVASQAAERARLRTSLRAELGVGDGVLLLGAAGILSRRKNFELLITAFAKTRLDDVQLALIGDGTHRVELERLVAELGLADRVYFLGALVHAADAIGGLDLFVLSSTNEGMANVMLEAMASCTPVIASDISGVRTAIGVHGERPAAGWIFPADDGAALAATLVEVTGAIRHDPESVRSRTSEALWRIENWFAEGRMLDDSERILFS